MIKTFLIFVFVGLFSKLSLGGIIQTAKSGNWTDSNTWINGIQPCKTDSVLINTGDTVFINTSLAQSSHLINKGVVYFNSQTNFLKCNETNFENGEITGTSLGSFHTESITFSNKSILGKCHLNVSKNVIIKDSLIITSASGAKYFGDFTNNGTLLNTGSEDINLHGNFKNNGEIKFNQGTIIFLRSAVVSGKLSVARLKLTDSLIVLGSLTVLNEIEGKGELINKGTIKLGMMNSNFKIDSLNLNFPGNELHLIRDGQQEMPATSFQTAKKVVFSGGGDFNINDYLSADTIEIKNNSSLEISNECSIGKLFCLDDSKLINSNNFYLHNAIGLTFSKTSTLELNNNQTLERSIQVGNLVLAPSISFELNIKDTLYIGGNFLGKGFVSGDPIIEYNGDFRQIIKKRNYKTLVYNNSCIDSSTFYGDYTITNLKVKNGKLKIGNLLINKCQIDSLGQILIGGNAPVFDDTTQISGRLIINSNQARPIFDFITVTSNGVFCNNSSANITISKGIKNDGKFSGCLGTACDYIFSTDSASLSGKDTIYISRIKGNTIYNNGIISITKEIDLDSLFNLSNGTILISADTQNISGSMDFKAIGNSVVFNKEGNQTIPKSFNILQNVIFQNSGNKFISSDLTVMGDLRIQKKAHLKTDSFQIIGNAIGEIFIDSLASISLGHNLSMNPIEFPLLFSNINCHDSSSVIYASKGNQKIYSKPCYGNLIIDDGAVDSCEKYISGDSLIIKGNLKLSESSLKLLVMNKTIDLDGDWNGPGKIYLSSGKFHIGGNGNSTGQIYPGNSEFVYDGVGNQKIKIGDYYDLTIDKIGSAYTKANIGSLFVKNNTWVKNGKLNFSSEKSVINNLIVDDSVSFSSKYQEKYFENIKVNSTGLFFLNYDEEINITGDVHCDGNFICNQGKIFFSDSLMKQTLTGTGKIDLGQISICKQSNSLIIDSDLNLLDTLFFENGSIELNGKMQLKSFGYILGESSSNSITGLGKISFNEDITEGKHEDINGIGLTLISASNMGNTLIEREFKSCHLENGESINRVYLIEPSSNLNLDVTMHFSYFDSELNGNQEDDLLVFKSIDEGNEWSKKGGIVDTTNNLIKLSGINSFSKWTLGPSSVKFLAVEFISFGAMRGANDEILISWEVLSEVGTKAYQINYSFDGIHFDSLNTCKATNNFYYEFIWRRAPNEMVYLELIEIDNNHTRSHLDTIVVKQAIGKIPEAWVFEKKIYTKNFPTGTLNVYDVRGRLIMQNKNNIYDLPKGTYYIELVNEVSRWTYEFLL